MCVRFSIEHPIRLGRLSACIAASAIFLAACTINPYTGEEQASKAAIGAGIGAAAGATIGLLTGDDSRERRRNALIGAGVGGIAGGGIGYYMDVQEAKLRQELTGAGVQVTRVGDSIILNMDEAVTFDTDSASVRPSSYRVLDAVSKVLAEYDKTVVDVMGHTDSDGSADYNQALSERRARSVASYLSAGGIEARRLLVVGYGESRPVATNSTAAGKQANRRVEIQIAPLT